MLHSLSEGAAMVASIRENVVGLEKMASLDPSLAGDASFGAMQREVEVRVSKLIAALTQAAGLASTADRPGWAAFVRQAQELAGRVRAGGATGTGAGAGGGVPGAAAGAGGTRGLTRPTASSGGASRDGAPRGPHGLTEDTAEDDDGPLPPFHFGKQLNAMESEVEIRGAIIRERNEEFEGIAAELVAVHQTFKDLVRVCSPPPM